MGIALVNNDLSQSNLPATSISLSRRCDWTQLGAVREFRHDGCSLALECGGPIVRISPERGGIVRVRATAGGRFGRDLSWAIVDPAPENIETRIEENERLHLITPGLRVIIDRDPCRIAFETSDDLIAQDDPDRAVAWAGGHVSCWKLLRGDDHVFGLGEKSMPLDKRGQCLVNWNSDDFDNEPWTDPLYQTHPFMIVVNARRAYGLLFDNTWRSWFDFGKTVRHSYGFGADGGELNYYILPGPTVAEVLAQYAALVGTTPLPPLWSLGYQQCRWSYESADRIRKIAREFRRRRIPCDTLYFDIDYMDGFRCFTWHRRNFRKPRALLDELRRTGFKVVTILDPGIKVDPRYQVYESGRQGDHYCRNGDGQPYVGKVWPGETVFPDFTRGATRAWWGEQYRTLTDAGVRGFWNDMNEPADFAQPDKTPPLSMRFDNEGEPSDHRALHNVYGMQMTRATFEGLQRLRPNERPFVLTRAGYAGVQRYAAVWTGDNLSSWEHLRASIPMLLNLGLSGVTFCGADIGGFRKVATPELFTRWLQLGILYPLCRVHTCQGPEQDPWSYGRKHEAINRRAIELRYRLLPYIYTEIRQAFARGQPLIRPLLMDFPDDPDVHKACFEFMFGRALFAAPVVEEGATKRVLRLPSGRWHEFASGRPHAGGEEIGLAVDVSSIPLFARSGAIIPLADVMQYTQERPLDKLTLTLFPGDGDGELYWDDGITYGYQQGEYVLERYEQRMKPSRRSLTLAAREGQDRFAPKVYLARFVGVSAPPSAVYVAGRKIAVQRGSHGAKVSSPRWKYDRRTGTIEVSTRRLAVGESIELRFARR